MFARKLKVEVLVGGQRRPAPLDWLDGFCMRNFTGSAEFDDTLPTGEGMLEAGLKSTRNGLPLRSANGLPSAAKETASR
jgi:hypothetical protein